MKRILLVLALPAVAALAGCQTLAKYNPFGSTSPDYKAAQQEQPLEVPPGMEQPANTEALTIPTVNATGTAAAGNPNVVPSAPPAAQAPPAAEMPSTAPPPATTPPEAAVGSSLAIADTPESTYNRVGLALSRGGVTQMIASDDTAHSYQVGVNSVERDQDQGGFFHRLFHRDTTTTVTGTVTVQITPQASGSLIQASGNPAAVERVMALLKQRLGVD